MDKARFYIAVAYRSARSFFRAVGRLLAISLRWVDSHNGLLTAAATIAIAVLTYYVAQLTSEQAKIANRQLSIIESDERPWIATKIELIGSLIITEKSAEIRTRITLENVGKTPAFNVVPIPIIAASIFPNALSLNSYLQLPINPIEEVKKTCETYSKTLSGAVDRGLSILFGNTIFPNKTFVKEETAVIRFDSSSPNPLLQQNLRMTGPAFLVSCVNYRASADPAYHQTGDVFYLDRQSPDDSNKVERIDLAKPEIVRKEDLKLIPYALGAYAN